MFAWCDHLFAFLLQLFCAKENTNLGKFAYILTPMTIINPRCVIWLCRFSCMWDDDFVVCRCVSSNPGGIEEIYCCTVRSAILNSILFSISETFRARWHDSMPLRRMPATFMIIQDALHFFRLQPCVKRSYFELNTSQVKLFFVLTSLTIFIVVCDPCMDMLEKSKLMVMRLVAPLASRLGFSFLDTTAIPPTLAPTSLSFGFRFSQNSIPRFPNKSKSSLSLL